MKKKLNLLYILTLFALFVSCKKEMSEDPLPQLSENDIILSRIDHFKKEYDFHQSHVTREFESDSVILDSAVWLMEASLNYDLTEWTEAMDSLANDSLIFSLPYTQDATGEHFIKKSDVFQAYNMMKNFSEQKYPINGQRKFMMGNLEVKGINGPNIEFGLYVTGGQIVNQLFSDFLPNVCYVGYSNYTTQPGTPPGPAAPNNAAKIIQTRIKATKNILFLPVGGFFVNQTGFSGWITSNSYVWTGQTCPSDNQYALTWGSPQFDGLWHSNTAQNTLCYSELVDKRDKCLAWIDFITPMGLQLADIQYETSGELEDDQPTVLFPCYPTFVRYEHGFRARWGKLVVKKKTELPG
jgi:hypothetical protein